MSKGYKTSEMWITLLSIIVGPTGILTMFADKLDPKSLGYVIVACIAAVGAIVWKYISARAEVKAAASQPVEE